MLTRWMTKPYRPFFIISALTMLVSLSYYLFDRESYFDVSIGNYINLSSYYAWLFFGLYTLVLGAIYYIAARNDLRTRRWLLITHFVFVVLFIVLFFLLSSLNSPAALEFVRGRSFFAVMVAYGSLYLLDLFFLFSGLMLLLANLFSLRRKK